MNIIKKIKILSVSFRNKFLDIYQFTGFNVFKIPLHIKIRPYTMITSFALNNAYMLSKIVEKKKLKGSFVECGVWKGGCIALMAYVAKKYRSNRKIWLFDSFEGLPEPTKKDGVGAKKYASDKDSGNLKSIDKNVGPLTQVKKLFFSKLKINRENVIIIKGWFQNTLPKAKKEIGPISILRIDGDWYESTKVCLENLYGNVVSNGYVIIDDYHKWEGCRKAVDEFFKKRKIKVKLIKIDYTAVFFQKK